MAAICRFVSWWLYTISRSYIYYIRREKSLSLLFAQPKNASGSHMAIEQVDVHLVRERERDVIFFYNFMYE